MEQILKPISGFVPTINLNLPPPPQTPKNKNNPETTLPTGPGLWSGYQDSVAREAMVQNHENFNRSGPPARMMQWREGAWVELGREVLALAGTSFLQKKPMVVDADVDGNDCILDFYRMLLVDVVTGLQRSIAWIDVHGECFFPKFFVDESLVDDNDDNDDDENDVSESFVVKNKCPKIEIEIKFDANKNLVNNVSVRNNDSIKKDYLVTKKRKAVVVKDDEDTANSSCNANSNNEKRKSEEEKGKGKRQCVVERGVRGGWRNARLLSEGEKACTVVRELFMNGMRMVDSGVKITSIHQFVRSGAMEKARWEAFHKQMQMTEAARGRSNTVFAWYGASKKEVSDILAHGIGCPSKSLGPQSPGVGVYLSPARVPQLSGRFAEADDDGERHLLLCRVVLGNFEKVEAGSRQVNPSSDVFDNGVDDVASPKWYVVWTTNMNTHILPECVVSYKCSDSKLGLSKEADFTKWVPKGSTAVVGKLFSKLESSLPAVKVEVLKALCIAFKGGKMAKELFIKELKSVVGDEILLSAISEIQGAN